MNIMFINFLKVSVLENAELSFIVHKESTTEIKIVKISYYLLKC